MSKQKNVFRSALFWMWMSFLALIFFGCDPKPDPIDYQSGVYECFSFREGQHAPKGYDYFPPKFRIQNTSFYAWEFKVTANASALYAFETADSLDWLKGYVISDDGRRFDKNNKAIGWRSRNGKTFDFTWYANHDYQIIFPDENRDVLRDIKPGQPVFMSVTYGMDERRVDTWIWKEGFDRSQESIDSGHAVFKRFDNIPYDPNIFWLVDPWFGGTFPAPNDMEDGLCIDAALKLTNSGTYSLKIR
jgi:hypothetical protein